MEQVLSQKALSRHQELGLQQERTTQLLTHLRFVEYGLEEDLQKVELEKTELHIEDMLETLATRKMLSSQPKQAKAAATDTTDV